MHHDQGVPSTSHKLFLCNRTLACSSARRPRVCSCALRCGVRREPAGTIRRKPGCRPSSAARALGVQSGERGFSQVTAFRVVEPRRATENHKLSFFFFLCCSIGITPNHPECWQSQQYNSSYALNSSLCDATNGACVHICV